MPGFELWSDAERKHLSDVAQSGVLMRYGFDGNRNGHFKAKELEAEICNYKFIFIQLTESLFLFPTQNLQRYCRQ
jgi:hypothetical protein